MRDKGTSDVFTRGSVELFAFIEQGSSELQQRHKSSHLESSYHVPPRLPQSGLLNDDDSLEISEHIPTWPAVEDLYVTSLVVAFHTRCGCNIATLHAYIAVLRVLQLQTLLHLDTDIAAPPNKRERVTVAFNSDITSISQAVTILPSLSQLFGKDILSNMCSPSSPSLSANQQHSSSGSSTSMSVSMSSAIGGIRFDFIRYCFQRLVLTGGPEELKNQAATVVSWTPESLPSHSTSSAGSNSYTGCAVAANAAVICYQLGDLWGLNVQKIRSMHMAVLLDADMSDHGLSFTSAEMCVWRDFEVENLLPLVSYNLMLNSSIS